MSVWYDIIDDLASELTTVLTPYDVPVVIRRRDVYLNDDPLPICIISPGDSESVESLDFAGEVTWEYPVIVNLVYPDNRQNDLSQDAQDYLDIRQEIRYQLYFYNPIPNVETVWDTNMDGTKPFSLVEQRATYSTTKWEPKFRSLEPRRTN